MNYLLWWKDGGITDMLSTQCLTTAKCVGGVRFALDLALLSEFGRVVYYERGPNMTRSNSASRKRAVHLQGSDP